MRSLMILGVLLLAGCGSKPGQAELVWGRRGVVNGDMVRPRAMTIDAQDRITIVDFTARLQTYDRDGKYLGITWQTPDYRRGRPSGLSLARDGNLLVCDSHYHCLRVYNPQGELLRTMGGEAGPEPGQLGYVSDVVQDADGTCFVAEFGEVQRISVLDAGGKFLRCWGREGTEPGEFSRLRALALGPDGLLYAVDACNHRIQVFDRQGKLQRIIGQAGSERGELLYPSDIAFTPEGDLAIVEKGNHRVQLFSRSGETLGTWGGPGRGPGQLHSPWALVVDSRGAIHVADTENHRVQRIRITPDREARP